MFLNNTSGRALFFCLWTTPSVCSHLARRPASDLLLAEATHPPKSALFCNFIPDYCSKYPCSNQYLEQVFPATWEHMFFPKSYSKYMSMTRLGTHGHGEFWPAKSWKSFPKFPRMGVFEKGVCLQENLIFGWLFAMVSCRFAILNVNNLDSICVCFKLV